MGDVGREMTDKKNSLNFIWKCILCDDVIIDFKTDINYRKTSWNICSKNNSRRICIDCLKSKNNYVRKGTIDD
mgnify:CR=1 FL=1